MIKSVAALKLFASSMQDEDILRSLYVLSFNDIPNKDFSIKEAITRRADAKEKLNLVERQLIAKEVCTVLKNASALFDSELANITNNDNNFIQPKNPEFIKSAKFGLLANVNGKYHLVNPLTNRVASEFIIEAADERYAKLHELVGQYRKENKISYFDESDGMMVLTGSPEVINDLEHKVKDIGYYCESVSEETGAEGEIPEYSLKVFLDKVASSASKVSKISSFSKISELRDSKVDFPNPIEDKLYETKDVLVEFGAHSFDTPDTPIVKNEIGGFSDLVYIIEKKIDNSIVPVASQYVVYNDGGYGLSAIKYHTSGESISEDDMSRAISAINQDFGKRFSKFESDSNSKDLQIKDIDTTNPNLEKDNPMLEKDEVVEKITSENSTLDKKSDYDVNQEVNKEQYNEDGLSIVLKAYKSGRYSIVGIVDGKELFVREVYEHDDGNGKYYSLGDTSVLVDFDNKNETHKEMADRFDSESINVFENIFVKPFSKQSKYKHPIKVKHIPESVDVDTAKFKLNNEMDSNLEKTTSKTISLQASESLNKYGEVVYSDDDGYYITVHTEDDSDSGIVVFMCWLFKKSEKYPMEDIVTFESVSDSNFKNNKINFANKLSADDMSNFGLTNEKLSQLSDVANEYISNKIDGNSSKKSEELVNDIDKESKVVKKDDKYQAQSEKGKNFGTYDTKEEAENRVKQMEMFKHMDKDASKEIPMFVVDASEVENVKVYADNKLIGTCKTVSAAFEKVEEKIDFEKELMEAGESKGKKDKVNKEQLEMGKKVEKEHTTNPEIAEKITRDHLAEIPDYYTHLKEMEDNAKKNNEVKSSYAPFMTVDAIKKEVTKTAEDVEDNVWVVEKTSAPTIDDQLTLDIFYVVNKNTHVVAHDPGFEPFLFPTQKDAQEYADKLNSQKEASAKPELKKEAAPTVPFADSDNEVIYENAEYVITLTTVPTIPENIGDTAAFYTIKSNLGKGTRGGIVAQCVVVVNETGYALQGLKRYPEELEPSKLSEDTLMEAYSIVQKDYSYRAAEADKPVNASARVTAKVDFNKLLQNKTFKDADDLENTINSFVAGGKVLKDDADGFTIEALEEDGKHTYKVYLLGNGGPSEEVRVEKVEELTEQEEKPAVEKKADEELKQFDMKQELDGQKEFEKQDDFSQVSVPEEKEDTSEVNEAMSAKPTQNKGESFSASEFGNNLAYIKQNNPEDFESIMANLKQLMVGDQKPMYDFLELWSQNNFQNFTETTRVDPTYERHSQYQEQLKNNVLPKVMEMSEYKKAMEEKVSAEKGA